MKTEKKRSKRRAVLAATVAHYESRAARIHGVACVNSERRGARGLGGA